jgi:hypothetical protein
MIIVCLFLQSRAVRIDTGTGASVDVALTAVSITRGEVRLRVLESMQFITNINHNGDRKLKESELADGGGCRRFAPQNEQGGTRALSVTSSSVFGFRSLTVFGFLSKTPSVMDTATTIAVASTTLITMTLVRRGRVDMALCCRHGRRTCHV